MRFPNAFGGVKKIWLAEILGLIGSLCLLIMGFVGVGAAAGAAGALSESNEGALVAAGAGVLGASVFGLAGGVLGILAFIFNLVGLNQAGKDEVSFKQGFYAALIGIVVSIIGAFFSGNTVVATIFNIVSFVIQAFIFFCVINGVKALAQQYGNQELIRKGDNVLKIYLAVLVVGVIASLVSLFAPAVAGVMSIVASIASIVDYVLYIIFLSNAKKMLAA